MQLFIQESKMQTYVPNGKSSAEKIRDLVGQATATGEFTVARIGDVDICAWPHDDPVEVYKDYAVAAGISV